jgi:hypothetical protein
MTSKKAMSLQGILANAFLTRAIAPDLKMQQQEVI